jgi:C1A family cysteine protease
MSEANGNFPTIRKSVYGWIPDLPDKRDKLFTQLTAVMPPVKLPRSVDLRQKCSPIENQGQLGSCTANALAGNLEYLKILEYHKNLDFSRLFIYYNERVISHTTGIDSGASLRDGIKTLVKLGACPEKEWPYDIDRFTVKPTENAYQDALNYQITAYYRIITLNQMKQTLATGYPFVYGFSVYESFESEAVSKTGIVPMPADTEHLIGGHAVMAVGYDYSKQQMIVRNSWGTSWGDKGYFYMPYNYISNSNLASDFWTVRNME